MIQYSLPKLTDEMIGALEDTCLIHQENGEWVWTQDAVDFVCILNYRNYILMRQEHGQ